MLLKRQTDINAQRGMSVDDKGQSSTIVSVTGETVQLYYSVAGVMTADAGQATGTVVVGQLAYDNIKNQLGSIEGSALDSSLSFTSTALTTEVTIDWVVFNETDYGTALNRMTSVTNGLTDGQYCVDYTNGTIFGKKASTQSSLTAAAYKVQSGVSSSASTAAQIVDITKIGGATTAASAALADATANPTVGSFGAYLSGFNGATWDRLRTAVTAATSTLTGLLSTIGIGQFNVIPPSPADGQVLADQKDSRGNSKVAINDGANQMAVGTAGADAVSNTQNTAATSSRISGFNGTTWDRLRTAVVASTATLTGWLNTLPWAVYNATPTTRTEGQGGPLQATTLGGLHVAEQFAAGYENNSDNIAWVHRRPITSSTAAITTDLSAALEASTVTKASAGRLYGYRVRVDSTHATATYYVQFLNASSLPADGAVTFLVAPIKVQHTTGTDTTIGDDFEFGVYASTGMVMCLSTTEFTKTISGAFTASTIFYA